jgi:hypothetical protein
MHLYVQTKSTALISLVLFCFNLPTMAQSTSWTKLFNGNNLTDWETYLVPSVAANDKSPIGLNKDPHGVFSVVDGTLRISGQDWGGIVTKDSYSNYHLRFQVKWGEKKWAPREGVVPDGGLLFHCSLPYDFGSKCWMRSLELQIQETDIGDYHNVGAGIPKIQTSTSIDDQETVDQYAPGAAFKRTDKRVFRSGNFESPKGEWTTVELIARDADAVFIVNGFVVNRLFDIYRNDLHQQVTEGRIQFQSEGAEHFLRNIELRTINQKQEENPQLVSSKKELRFAPGQTHQLLISNQGIDVELVAAELLGKNLEQWNITLPKFPHTLKKGEVLRLPVQAKANSTLGSKAILMLETVTGTVKNFAVTLQIN